MNSVLMCKFLSSSGNDVSHGKALGEAEADRLRGHNGQERYML